MDSPLQITYFYPLTNRASLIRSVLKGVMLLFETFSKYTPRQA